MKKAIIAILLTVLCISILQGCESAPNADDVLGKWEGTIEYKPVTVTFREPIREEDDKIIGRVDIDYKNYEDWSKNKTVYFEYYDYALYIESNLYGYSPGDTHIRLEIDDISQGVLYSGYGASDEGTELRRVK